MPLPFATLDDLCSNVIDCSHETPQWKSEGFRVLRNFNLDEGNLDFSKGFYVDEETFQRRIRRARPTEDDVIVSREAPMGKIGIIPGGLECCLGQRLVLLRADQSKCNPKYLAFALMSEYAQTQFCRADTTGSTVSNLTIPDLRRLVLPLHPQHNQVGEFLWKINQLIQFENAIAAELHEGIANVYLQLFAGRKPNGLLADLALNQPKSKVQVGVAKDAVGNVPFFTSGDDVLSWPEPMVGGRSCFLNTGGNPGVKFHVGPAAYSADTWCISGQNESTDYLYLLLDSIKFELGRKFFVGTGLRHLQKPLLLKRPIYVPDDKELQVFNQLSDASLTSWVIRRKSSEQLKKLRNVLLQNFMSGQMYFDD